MQETDDILDMLDSYILVNNSMAIDQNKGKSQYAKSGNIDKLLSARPMHQREFIDASTQTNGGFYCTAPIISDSQLLVKGIILEDECMDHDIVLVSYRRLNIAENLLIDAWTHTNTQGFVYSWPKITDDELSDDDTLFDEECGSKISESDQYPIFRDNLNQLIQKMRMMIPILHRGRIYDAVQFCKMRIIVGIHYGSIYFKRMGCIVLFSGKFVIDYLTNWLIN